MSMNTKIAVAMWTPIAPPATCSHVRARLTALIQRPFAGELRPQAGAAARFQQDVPGFVGVVGGIAVAPDKGVGSGPAMSVNTTVRIDQSYDEQQTGTSVWRPPV